MKHKKICKSLLAQKLQTNQSRQSLDELECSLNQLSSAEKFNYEELKKINSNISQLYKKLGLDRNYVDLDHIKPALQLSNAEVDEIELASSRYSPIEVLKFKNWDDYFLEVNSYLYRNDIVLTKDPIELLLSSLQLSEIEEKYRDQFKNLTWDKWDYIFVGASGTLASLTDFFLVRIPKAIKTGKYKGQSGSPITQWLKSFDVKEKSDDKYIQNDWCAIWARELEKKCKVPYDSMDTCVNGIGIQIPGMTGRSHRFQSLGHDPALGFIFGVLDIMRGTITGFSYDSLLGDHTYLKGQCYNYIKDQGPKLIEAILIQIKHLISDLATPMGLPAPFMTALQSINIGRFGDKNRSVGQLARWMYLNGYDFRHFLSSGITPAVVEIVLRAYIMIRHYSEHGKMPFWVAANPKYRNMLLFSHSIAAAGNIGKIALYHGNPLAINYAQWLTLTRYMIPCMKYWLFDKNIKLRDFYSKRWEELLCQSLNLYNNPIFDNLPLIELGKAV